MQHQMIGRTIGKKYALIERLGAGGTSSVYRARVQEDNSVVAIKIMPVHLAAQDTARERFLREARMTADLHHRHILPIYAYGTEDGVPFIVMKLLDGGTLDELIQRGPLPLDHAARILAQVAGALDYAHEQGVIHRDLKPQNILFDQHGTAYLADFGIARLAGATDSLTGTGDFIGTAAYASPEQCRGEILTPASDLYSLGVVFYEMLTGVLPYRGKSPLAIMHQHISEDVPNPLQDRKDLPLGLSEVMRKALAKLPAVRYQSAGAFSDAYQTVLRRELGTKPFADKAPPLGPDPVFDESGDMYTPLPRIPDKLLPDLAPAQAVPSQGAPPPPPPPLPVPPPARPVRSSSSLPNKYVTQPIDRRTTSKPAPARPNTVAALRSGEFAPVGDDSPAVDPTAESSGCSPALVFLLSMLFIFVVGIATYLILA